MAHRGLPVNRSEDFVFGICQRSFLSLWCNNNPIAEPGKELCDILVVCDPHIIILSVKDVQLGEGDPVVEHSRWERKSIEDSVNQIYGAERRLKSLSQVIRGDGSPGLNLPALDRRRVHRVAVAFGGRGETTITSGDFGKGFVHVMSEFSFLEVLGELDTITDLLNYLAAKEEFAGRCSVVVEGLEANLLGLYILNNRSFPREVSHIVVESTVWTRIRERPEFKGRKEADRESYIWDRLIEGLSDPKATPLHGPGPTLGQMELALRTMVREPRLSRRVLGGAVRQFLEEAKHRKLRSRILIAESGVIYVLGYFRASRDPKSWEADLGCDCVIARHKVGRGDTIVGIGLSEHVAGLGSGSTLIYMHRPDWSAADDEKAAKTMAELGRFEGAHSRHLHVDEYPTAG